MEHNGFEYIDLGLPSGTMWATMNVGANSVYDGGLFFQWNGDRSYTKNDILNGCKIANLTHGRTVQDNVNIYMGGKWKAPTLNHLIELTAYCRYEYSESINCCVLTSENNGNYILFPLDGYFFPYGVGINEYVKSHSRIWSTSKDFGRTYCLRFDVFKYNFERAGCISPPIVTFEDSVMLYNIRGIFNDKDVK